MLGGDAMSCRHQVRIEVECDPSRLIEEILKMRSMRAGWYHMFDKGIAKLSLDGQLVLPGFEMMML